MKSVVCWLWDDGSLRSKSFDVSHVNVLARMIARHLPEPHRFICITDETKGFDPGVEVIATPPAAAELGKLRTPEHAHFPSCYRRLWMFSEEAKVLGERVLLIDIDLVVVGDLRPLFDLPADFVGWRPIRDWGERCRFGGGIYLITPGSRTEVWNDFKGAESILEARQAGFRGSDQAWISYKLAHKEPHWNERSGIYSIRDMKGTEKHLPKDARLIQLNGPTKPWTSSLAWVQEHWR